MIAAPESMPAAQSCEPGTMLALMSAPADTDTTDRLERMLARATHEAERAADTLASELRVRVMAGLVRLEHDDPVAAALHAWHVADVARAVLEGAADRRMLATTGAAL